MSVELRVPQLGESITEAIIGKWTKKVGDVVSADEVVAVLETDKIAVDVNAPANGTLKTIDYPEGAKVKIGDIIGTVVPGAGASAVLSVKQATSQAEATGTKVEDRQNPSLTPVAKNIAAEKGIDVSKVNGTGVGGRVTKDDVLSARSSPAPKPAETVRPAGREERVKMTPLRKRVGERLLQAQTNAAILTTFNEVDMHGVMELRKTYQDAFVKKHGIKLGFMSFFVRATVEALRTFPAVNASIDQDEIVFHHFYDIGVAVSGSRGLVVPVVRDADSKSMAALEKEIGDLGARARNDKLTLQELSGGTFTISNGGIFGSMLSTPILNPPQTAILGMHNIVERPVVREGQIVIRPIMYLALSYDHRLIDGREAVSFLVKVKECIEAPERLLLEI